MSGAHQDFETASPQDLPNCGVHRYAEDPNTRVWCFSYRLDGGAVKRWKPGDPDPQDLLDYIACGGILTAHGAMFERTIWNQVIRVKYCPHWPELLAEQQDCTMARAAAVGHPQGLDLLCRVLHTKEQKDMEGSALMKKMAKPRRQLPNGDYEWWDTPENVLRLQQYNDTDVLTEEEVGDTIPPLTDYERRVWLLDQKINDRGIHIDINAARRAASLVEHAKKQADKEMRDLTNRQVPKCSNDAKLIAWINSRGIECDTVKKGAQEDLIFIANMREDATVERVLRLRGAAKKTSTAKYAAMLECVGKDNRIRGLLNYHGAGPGRWAGRLLQPQNLPRVDNEKEGYIVEWFHELLADQSLSIADIYDLIVLVHGGDYPLVLLSRALRSMICAAPGKKLVGGDFSNIEGRVNAWFADEKWKLQAFRDYDAGVGQDLYRLAYAKSFGIDIAQVDDGRKSGPQRQIGKVEELALGYQGSVQAVLDMGPTYGVDPYKLSSAIIKAVSAMQWDLTATKYEKANNKCGLQEREWTAITILVQNFRKANANIVKSWWDYQDAAVAAVAAPGTVVACAGGRVQYYSDGRCLWCILPSGRMIAYSYPQLEESWVEYIDKDGNVQERLKRSVTFWGYKEGQWKKLYMYGGLQCENVVQGTARCVMVDRMFAAEEANYPIILTVHDELLTEPWNNPGYNEKDFEQLLSTPPPFVEGLPLAAKAWEDARYVK